MQTLGTGSFRYRTTTPADKQSGPSPQKGKETASQHGNTYSFTITCLYYTSFGQKLKPIVIYFEKEG
jgi:hypothetical protein